MSFLPKLTLNAKLLSGFSLMILFMLVIGFTGYRTMKAMDLQINDLFATHLPAIDFLVEADRDLQQALVAERSMTFADPKSPAFKTLEGEHRQNLEQSQQRMGKFAALTSTPEEKRLVAGYEQARQKWLALTAKVVEGNRSSVDQERKQARDLSLGEASQAFEGMRDYLDKLQELTLKAAEEARSHASSAMQSAIILLAVVLGIAVLVGAALALTIGRGLTRRLSAIISDLSQSSDQVSQASQQVADSSGSLAQGASEQAASLEETSASLEEMASMTRQNAEHADQADKLMDEAKNIVGEANEYMGRLRQAMETINSTSDQTAKIIKTIDEIAFQTNLLALNAAVEAARAGEAGAGFAVVADEVRNLAMRAAEAAKNTSELIEGNIKDIRNGTDLVLNTDEAFQRVRDSAGRVGELVSEIAAASSEQAQGIDQVNKAVSDMDRVTQQNASSAEESAAASEEMLGQARSLLGYVDALEALLGGSGGGEPSAGEGQRPSGLLSWKPGGRAG